MLQLSKLASLPSSEEGLVTPLAEWDHFKSSSLLLTLKGAPEILLPYCSYSLDPRGGPPIPLSAPEKARIAAIQEKWSRQGQRVILLARRVINDQYLAKATGTNSEEFDEALDKYISNLIIVGLVGLIDPLKPDIKHTVQYVVSSPPRSVGHI
jgi:sodium/potassium-transporting ATPase subunit alpha